MLSELLKKKLYERLTINENDKIISALKKDISSTRELIIVHQMGRAASMTLVNTIKAMQLPQPVYHTHWLNRKTIKTRINKRGKSRQPLNVRVSSIISGELYHNRQSRKWKFVSVIREPVARNISAFFLSANRFMPNYLHRWRQGDLTIDEIQSIFLEKYPHTIPLKWFDEEVRGPVGIDLYDFQFEKTGGYLICEIEDISFLVLKNEHLGVAWRPAFSEYFRKTPEKLINTHVTAEQDDHAELYHSFVSTVSLPSNYLDEMYNSKYVQHFYSAEEIESFRTRWK